MPISPHPASIRAALIAFCALIGLLAPTSANAAKRIDASFKTINAGYMFTCGIKSDDTVKCFGAGYQGQLDVPADLGAVEKVSAGGAFACAIRTDDSLRCWGWPGNATLPAGLDKVIDVGAGHQGICAVKPDHTVVCWGDAPAPPTDLAPVKSIELGLHHACAILIDDTLRCWGSQQAPAGIGTVTKVAVAAEHSCALTTAGTPVCWGDNYAGKATPPAGLTGATAIAVSFGRSCVVTAAQQLRCWGASGTPDALDPGSASPDPPADLGEIRGLDAGQGQFCATRADHSWTCWGRDDSGSLGVEADGVEPTPPVVSSIEDYGNGVRVRGTAPEFTYWVVVHNGADCRGDLTQNTRAAFADRGIEVDAPATGALTVSVRVIDIFGLHSACQNVYTRPEVFVPTTRPAAPAPPAPATTGAEPAVILAPKLLDAEQVGARGVLLSGVAPKSAIGRTVTVKATLAGRLQLSRKTKVKPNGTFSVKLKLKTRKVARKSTYTAWLGGKRIGRLRVPQ